MTRGSGDPDRSTVNWEPDPGWRYPVESRSNDPSWEQTEREWGLLTYAVQQAQAAVERLMAMDLVRPSELLEALARRDKLRRRHLVLMPEYSRLLNVEAYRREANP